MANYAETYSVCIRTKREEEEEEKEEEEEEKTSRRWKKYTKRKTYTL
jgi:hypothetical protein